MGGRTALALAYAHAAIMPSLIALAGRFPWTVRWARPQPELFALGLCLLASPFVDKAIPVRPAG